MIKYVQPKLFNFKRVEQLLEQSAKINIYTNNGPVKQQLEQYLEKFFGLSHDKKVVCVNSGTSALYVLISLFEKQAGHPLKWLSPAFTFPVASVNRLSTDIVDIDPITCTIPLDAIEPYDGIIIPTLFGTIPDLKIKDYCKQHKKILIFDNASSPLSKYSSISINELGDACIGSSHHTKYLGCGESGFAVIPAALYDEFNYLANFGFSDDRKYHNLGTNAKLSDIAAAFTLSHIENYDVQKHIEIQNKYIEAINNIPNVKVFNPFPCATYDLVYGNMPVVFNRPISNLVFRDINVEANKYYKPLKPLPHSYRLYDRIVNLPLYSTLSDYDLGLILKKIEVEAKK